MPIRKPTEGPTPNYSIFGRRPAVPTIRLEAFRQLQASITVVNARATHITNTQGHTEQTRAELKQLQNRLILQTVTYQTRTGRTVPKTLGPRLESTLLNIAEAMAKCGASIAPEEDDYSDGAPSTAP